MIRALSHPHPTGHVSLSTLQSTSRSTDVWVNCMAYVAFGRCAYPVNLLRCSQIPQPKRQAIRSGVNVSVSCCFCLVSSVSVLSGKPKATENTVPQCQRGQIQMAMLLVVTLTAMATQLQVRSVPSRRKG